VFAGGQRRTSDTFLVQGNQLVAQTADSLHHFRRCLLELLLLRG
jgi:hypothetical protein